MAFEHAFATMPPQYEGTFDHLDLCFPFEGGYEASVFDATGDDGMMSFGDACRLLRDHGSTWSDYTGEGNTSLHPAHLLSFLGY